jgi:hypothetical protein
MHVVLRAVNLSSGERQLVVRAGQALRVGRTEWADCCVSADDAMGDVHFELACDGATCVIRDLGSGRETWLNDESITESTARDGDRITAGKTQFVIEIVGGPLDSTDRQDGDAEDSPDEAATGLAHIAAATAREVCEGLDFAEDTLELLDDSTPPNVFCERLVETERFSDAIRFLAHALPKREAVWWAACCADDVLVDSNEADVAALAAARAWVVDASEENRVAAGTAADRTKLNTAAGMTAQSAFWSGGSLAPADMPVVPPDQSMTASGVAGAVLMASVADDSQDPIDMFRRFVQYGTEVANGEQRWEES